MQQGSYVDGVEKACDVNDLHNELGHLLKYIAQATRKDKGLKVTGIFHVYRAQTLRKARKAEVSKLPAVC